MDAKMIDVDGHIMEPADLWQEYIEPEYRDRALHIARDDKGLEYLSIDGHEVELMQGGTLGAFGAIGKDARPYLTPGMISWKEAMVPGGYDPHERVKVMDSEEIDITIVYPTLGICWEHDCQDAKLAAACCRAYNNWVFDFCRPHPDRLVPVSHIPTLDLDEGIKELERTVKLGAKAVMINSVPPNNLPYGLPHYDRLWAAAQDADIPVSIHPGVGKGCYWARCYPAEYITTWWSFVLTPPDLIMHFTSFINEGTFDKFPKLKLVILESGIGWLVGLVDRMEEKYDVNGFTARMKLRPKEYVTNNCWFSMDPDERLARLSIEVLGADRFLWAYDYPHSDSILNPVRELRENMGPLPEADQRKVFGENAIKLYKLDV